MEKILKAAIAIVVCAALTGGAGAWAQQKHDSNTLHKIGNAIQYPIRKGAENLSTDIHRAEGKKSVHYDRTHNAKYVVNPEGHKVYKGPINRHAYAHRRHRHHSRR